MGGVYILSKKDIKNINPDFSALSLVSKKIAKQSQALVFQKSGKNISLLTTNNYPQAFHHTKDILEAQGYNVQVRYTDTESFLDALGRYELLEETQKQKKQQEKERKNASGDQAIKFLKDVFQKRSQYQEKDFLQEILRFSYQAGSSDVHFQTEESGIIMRIRRDGILQTIALFTHEEFQKYLLKLKYMSGVKMNVNKINQDGRFDLDIKKTNTIIHIDVRSSFLPGVRGESVVLRFLDASSGITNFRQLGYMKYQIHQIEQALQRKSGLILVTGPTGSGKTTSVYSLLHELNHPSKKIITIEDPVEYELAGIEQSQVNEKEGYTFEHALTGILRHDPDIIMVGEIRTLETANMAINAALTGHLVISTVHTNSAIETITRLLHMGVKPFMLASSLNLIIGQRLLRRVQRKKYIDTPKYVQKDIERLVAKLEKYGYAEHIKYTGKIVQVDKEKNTIHDGYSGRIGSFEILSINHTIQQCILQGKSTQDIFSEAQKLGFFTIKENAYIHMLQGITSIEEIERVLS